MSTSLPQEQALESEAQSQAPRGRLARTFRALQYRDYRLVEMYTFVAVVYFLISLSLSYVVKRLQARLAIVR